MSETIVNTGKPKAAAEAPAQHKTAAKPQWQKPKLEDVSEQVMAQPYIRFT
jgi:hypothetical protein